MKKTGLLHLVSMLLFFLCSMNLNAKGSDSFGQLLNPVMDVNALSETNEDENSFDNIVTRSDVDIVWTNDETYPWTINGATAKSGNKSISNSKSSLTFSYSSQSKTQLTFDWGNNDADYHSLLLYIDGVNKASKTSSSSSTSRFFIPEGNHVVEFRDTIWNGVSSWNQTSYVSRLSITEILPIENSVLSDRSQKISFSNDDIWPWTIEDGYIQSSNYGFKNSVSTFSTDFTITEPSKFSFWSSTYYYDSNNNSQTSSSYYYYYSNDYYHHFTFTINDEPYLTRRTYGSGITSLLLEPGDYHLEWTEDIADGSYYNFKTQVKNIELSSDWVEVDLSTNPGSLGVEVLYLVDVLSDVELLKVSGVMNATDWATIKQMSNLIALDLTDAKFDAVPEYAFNGLSKLSNVKLPEGLKTIEQYAFKGTQILSIDIPSTVTSIGKFAFSGTRIKSVTFPGNSQLTSIDNAAFYNCTSLREMLMPNTVTSVGYAAFEGCTTLQAIRFSDAITTIRDYTCSGCSALTSMHLPSNLQTIRYRSFYNTSSLRKVDIPSTVDRIYDYAFYNCGLDSLSLPVTLRYLHQYSFANCKNLKYVEMPSYLEQGSSSNTYYYANNDNITSSSRTMYYGYDYNFSDCTALETVVCQSATPPSIKNDPFSGSTAKSAITLVVPSFAVVNYKLDNYWYKFGSIVEGDDIDYWKITSTLSLTNNRRMNGKPDIDLYDGGKLVVGGAAPMPVGTLNYYGRETNPACLLNDCSNMTADEINTMFYFAANTWYFFTPTHDVDLTKVYHTADASYVFRYFDGSSRAANGTGSSWRNVDNGKLLAGQGYIFHCNANGYMVMPAGTADHARVLTTSDVKKNLSAYESTASANKSWNYVGNPYPCYYDIYYMDFTAPITVWTGSTYKAYSIVDDDFVLRPMQSFFVQKPDEVDAIVFHKEGRQISSTVDRASYSNRRANASSNRNFFNLQISNDADVVDETRIVLNDDAQLSYEIESDASKFISIDNNVPQLYSLDNEGNSYAINERPASVGVVRLGYRAAESGFYTISAIRADGDVTLFDTQLNKTVDLTAQDYTFYSEATNTFDNDRFVLNLGVTALPTNIADNVSNRVSVFSTNGAINVNAAAGSLVVIYTADGRNIYSGIINTSNTSVNVPAGAYVIKVNDSTFKTVVNQ